MENITFEQAMEELEVIVNKLESKGVSLEQSLEYFERGCSLIKICNTKLEKAKLVVKELGESISAEDVNNGEN